MPNANRLVALRHASPRRNVARIHARGLLPWLARGKSKVVWLHTAAQTEWAIRHVARRHKVAVDDVIVFEVLVPRGCLRRRSRGVWKCAARIPAEWITATNGLRVVG